MAGPRRLRRGRLPDRGVRGAAAEPERPRLPGSDVEHLLRRLHDLVSSARPMPLSTSVMVNRDEVLDLLDETIERLPEELRAARWLLKEREEFLAKVRREGDEILDQARARAERMVQRTEVVKASEARARKIVDLAEAEARRLRNEGEDFCDQKLASFEIVLERTQKMVGAGRAKLQGSLGHRRGARRGRRPDAPGDRRRPGVLRPRARLSPRGPLTPPDRGGRAAAAARHPAPRHRGARPCRTSRSPRRGCPRAPRSRSTASSRPSTAPSSLTGTVAAPWAAECRRCLDEVSGRRGGRGPGGLRGPPGRRGDLPARGRRRRPRAHASATRSLLHLPLAPLCRDDCRGPAPEAFPAAARRRTLAAEATAPARPPLGGPRRASRASDRPLASSRLQHRTRTLTSHTHLRT